LNKIKQNHPYTEVIMITGDTEVESAVESFQSGAYDYITKPLQLGELLAVIRRAVQKYSLVRQVTTLREALGPRQKRASRPALKSKIDTFAAEVFSAARDNLALKDIVDLLERAFILQALAHTNWNQVHAAKMLGIHRHKLIYRMQTFKIPSVLTPASKTKKGKL